jgi:hypothetical protein
MRTIICFAKDPRAEAGMWELIADAEARRAVTVGELRRHGPRQPQLGAGAL